MSTMSPGRATLMMPGDKIVITQVETGGVLIERKRGSETLATHIAQTPNRAALLVKMEVEQSREEFRTAEG